MKCIRDWTFEDYYVKLENVIDIWINKYKGMKTESEDLKQEAYILLFSNVDKLNEKEEFEAYFAGMLKNVFNQLLKIEHEQGLWIESSFSSNVDGEELNLLNTIESGQLQNVRDPWLEEYYKKRRDYQKEYRKKPGVKEKQREYQKRYCTRPEIKEQIKEYYKEYCSRPEVRERKREYHKEYNSRPEVKELKRVFAKEYYSRPENKERRKEYQKQYREKPENREKNREYQRQYREKKKQEKLLAEQNTREKDQPKTNGGPNETR